MAREEEEEVEEEEEEEDLRLFTAVVPFRFLFFLLTLTAPFEFFDLEFGVKASSSSLDEIG